MAGLARSLSRPSDCSRCGADLTIVMHLAAAAWRRQAARSAIAEGTHTARQLPRKQRHLPRKPVRSSNRSAGCTQAELRTVKHFANTLSASHVAKTLLSAASTLMCSCRTGRSARNGIRTSRHDQFFVSRQSHLILPIVRRDRDPPLRSHSSWHRFIPRNPRPHNTPRAIGRVLANPPVKATASSRPSQRGAPASS